MTMQLLKNTLRAIKDRPERSLDIIDSFSDNQFKSKDKLIQILDSNNLIGPDSVVAIFGCWYGSILIEYLAPRVKHIYAIDMDDDAIAVGKNYLFPHYENVTWSTYDIFERGDRGVYRNVSLFINTSCEHMRSMKEWPWFPQGAFFAFQSNNMFDIEGHTNCVNNLEEFEEQLPHHFLLDEEEIEDTRGTRFTLIGKIC